MICSLQFNGRLLLPSAKLRDINFIYFFYTNILKYYKNEYEFYVICNLSQKKITKIIWKKTIFQEFMIIRVKVLKGNFIKT